MAREIILPPMEGYRLRVPPLDERMALMVIYPTDAVSPEALEMIETYPEGQAVSDVNFRVGTRSRWLRDAARAIEAFGYARIFERMVTWEIDLLDGVPRASELPPESMPPAREQ